MIKSNNINISGVKLNNQKTFLTKGGSLGHIIKKNEKNFFGFGEAYYTSIKYNKIRGWKLHKKMIVNLMVLIGKMEIIIFDNRKNSKTNGKFKKIILNENDGKRLTINKNLWFAFKGISKTETKIINISNILYDKKELLEKKLNEIKYDWS